MWSGEVHVNDTATFTDLFFRSKRVAIIQFLLQHRDQTFTVQDITDHTPVSYATAHRVITQLTSLGIITRKQTGGYNQIQINMDSPYIPVLEEISRLDMQPFHDVASTYVDAVREQLDASLVTAAMPGPATYTVPTAETAMPIYLLLDARADDAEEADVLSSVTAVTERFAAEHGIQLDPVVLPQPQFWRKIETGDINQELVARGVLLHETRQTRVDWYMEES